MGLPRLSWAKAPMEMGIQGPSKAKAPMERGHLDESSHGFPLNPKAKAPNSSKITGDCFFYKFCVSDVHN